MEIHRYSLTLLEVPADLRADPDGEWTYDGLVVAAGLDPDASPAPIVAALYAPWRGHPEGSAVVASPGEGWLAIIHVAAIEAAAFTPAKADAPLKPAPRRSVSRAA
ncbi:MAG TPA: hypothetical protein VHC69_08975 [Polyangiaceae bacterium]|nr:hypothetical protein [Polyangiaceae bacterium]